MSRENKEEKWKTFIIIYIRHSHIKKLIIVVVVECILKFFLFSFIVTTPRLSHFLLLCFSLLIRVFFISRLISISSNYKNGFFVPKKKVSTFTLERNYTIEWMTGGVVRRFKYKFSRSFGEICEKRKRFSGRRHQHFVVGLPKIKIKIQKNSRPKSEQLCTLLYIYNVNNSSTSSAHIGNGKAKNEVKYMYKFVFGEVLGSKQRSFLQLIFSYIEKRIFLL